MHKADLQIRTTIQAKNDSMAREAFMVISFLFNTSLKKVLNRKFGEFFYQIVIDKMIHCVPCSSRTLRKHVALRTPVYKCLLKVLSNPTTLEIQAVRSCLFSKGR